jgi:hypothetical protein
MDGRVRQILNVVVVIALVIWLLQAFGILGSLGGIRVGQSGAEPGESQEITAAYGSTVTVT